MISLVISLIACISLQRQDEMSSPWRLAHQQWRFLYFSVSISLVSKAAAVLSFLHLLKLVLDFGIVVTNQEWKNNPGGVLFNGYVFLDYSTLFYSQASFFVSVYLYFRALYLKPAGVLSLNLYLLIDHRRFSLAFVLCVGGTEKVAELLRGWVRASRDDARGR